MKFFPDILPAPFGLVILTFTFICFVAPYVSGHDFGIFKVPNFRTSSRRSLMWLGPTLFSLAVLAHLPILPSRCLEPVMELVTDTAICGTLEKEYEETPRSPMTCRNESFGQEGWRYTEEIRENSGWMPGGHTRSEWCNTMVRNFLRGRSIDSSHESSVVSTEEDERWSGTLNRTRQYNYTCTASISWQPIFSERTDGAVCGWHPAVMSTRKIAATCEQEVGQRRVPCGA